MTPPRSPMQNVALYADGACGGNPGPGGWGAVLVCDDPAARAEYSGAAADTTNNRMELTAVIEGLARLRRPCRVTVVTDSRYVVDAFAKGWTRRWLANGWRTADKKPVKNEDLWRALLDRAAPHDMRWQWIRGHAGHAENERCDQLAVAARRRLAP